MTAPLGHYKVDLRSQKLISVRKLYLRSLEKFDVRVNIIVIAIASLSAILKKIINILKRINNMFRKLFRKRSH